MAITDLNFNKTKVLRQNAFCWKIWMGDNQTCEWISQKAGRNNESEWQAVKFLQKRYLPKESDLFGLLSGWVRVAYPKSG
jgi:hypothetical protein